MKDWYQKSVCKLHIDFHTPDDIESICANLNAEKVADKIVTAGFDAVQIFTKGHFGNSYYPTKAGHRHPALKRDLFGELAEAFIKRGVIVMAYYSLRPDSYQAEKHPDWTVRSELIDKEFAHMSDNRSMCFQSPYLEEVALPQIREVAEKYPISSFFFDFARSTGYCGCSYCQKKYFEATGNKLPENDPSSANWDEYVVWKRGEQIRVESQLDKAVHDSKPEAHITVNYSYTLRNPETTPDYYGFISMDVLERCSYGLNVSLNAKYLAAKGKDFDIMTSRMINWWSGWGLKPLNALLYQNAVILAHGGRTFLADRADINWELDDTVYSYFKKANDFIKSLKDICLDTELQADIGVFISRAAYNSSRNPSNQPMEGLLPIQGAHRILTSKHYQHLILDEDSLKKYIEKIRLLIIPEQSLIDDSSIELIKGFVANGGTLIASGSTINSNPVMNEILGAEEKSSFNRAFISPPEWTVDENIPNLEIACDCPAKTIKTDGAHILMNGYIPVYNLEGKGLGFGSPDKTRIFTAVSENKFGTGKAIYIALDIFSCYININNPPIKHLIDKLISTCIPKRLLETNTHENMEIVVAEKDNKLMVHLINFAEEKSESIGQTAMIDQLPPTGDFMVKVRCLKTVKAVESYPERKKVEWEKEGNYIKIKVKSFTLYKGLSLSLEKD
jgi:putative glycosyl hydrolase-like family 6 (GHL6) protein